MGHDMTDGRTPSGGADTAIVRKRGGGGAGWLAAVALLIAVLAGVYVHAKQTGGMIVVHKAHAGAGRTGGHARGDSRDAAKDAGGED